MSFLVTKMFETFSSVLERLERAESKSALELTLDSNPCLLFFKFGKDDLTPSSFFSPLAVCCTYCNVVVFVFTVEQTVCRRGHYG